MLLRRTCFYLCVHLWLNGATCAADPGGADAKPPSVCGPRCARSVLEHYGKPMELLPLIAEMQGGIPVQACSLRDVQDALERRGIYCLALKTGIVDFPGWPEPVILHYKRGHFVVLEETKGGYARIRDGVNMEPAWVFVPEVMLRQSGAVLLTSASPIKSTRVIWLRWPRLVAAVCCALLGFAGILMCRLFLRSLLSRCSCKGGN